MFYFERFVIRLFFMLAASVCHAAGTWYVTTNGAGVADGSDWDNAFSNIQDGIRVAVDGTSDDYATVLAAAGTYQFGGVVRDVGYILTNRVALTNAYVVVMSANNDPTNTIIKGAWDAPDTTNGPAAVRCAYMASNTKLIGFTLTNGATLDTGTTEVDGGGVLSGSTTSAIISNCIVAGNNAFRYGGGGNNGYFVDCKIINNYSISQGGGTRSSSASNCLIAGNTSGGDGGGANRGNLLGCFVVSNSSAGNGSAINRSALDNCTIAYNSGDSAYTVVYPSKVQNCLVYGNGDTYALWISNGVNIESCTIIGNASRGIYQQNIAAITNVILNSIVYSNAYANNWQEYTAGKFIFSNTCTTAGTLPKNYATIEEFMADGNTTNNPMLIDFGSGYGTSHIEGNYGLQPASPCVNRGLNQSWMADALDRDGNPRIRNRVVDMGCYETFLRGSIYSIR